MELEFSLSSEANVFSDDTDQEALINRLARQEMESPKTQQFDLGNGITRTTDLDSNGKLIAVTDSDGKQRLKDFNGNWQLYQNGKIVDTGFDIVDLKVSRDGKSVTMGVIGEHKGVIIETPNGSIAAKEGGQVVGTNKEVLSQKQNVLEALKQFLASPEAKKAGRPSIKV